MTVWVCFYCKANNIESPMKKKDLMKMFTEIQAIQIFWILCTQDIVSMLFRKLEMDS